LLNESEKSLSLLDQFKKRNESLLKADPLPDFDTTICSKISENEIHLDRLNEFKKRNEKLQEHISSSQQSELHDDLNNALNIRAVSDQEDSDSEENERKDFIKRFEGLKKKPASPAAKTRCNSVSSRKMEKSETMDDQDLFILEGKFCY
jgi:hypothetical protein